MGVIHRCKKMQENSVQSKKQPQPPHEAKLVSLPEEQQIKAMMRLWERMTDTAELWLQGLGRFTLSEIGNGVNEMVEKGQEWPPTLPEFMAMCKPKHLAPYHKMAKALPAPEVDSAIAHTELAKIRALIAKRKAA